MNLFGKVFQMLSAVCLVCAIVLCNTRGSSTAAPINDATTTMRVTKPPSSLQDTLVAHASSAIFYYPDSLQLIKYKAAIDSNAYKSIDHEFFYQLHYAHLAIKKYWPKVYISDCKGYRYIKFIKPDTTFEIIDLLMGALFKS